MGIVKLVWWRSVQKAYSQEEIVEHFPKDVEYRKNFLGDYSWVDSIFGMFMSCTKGLVCAFTNSKSMRVSRT